LFHNALTWFQTSLNIYLQRSSYAGRRTETFTFLDTDSDIFTPRSASDSYGTATYYRHVRDPSSDGFAEVASNIHIPFSLSFSWLIISACLVRLNVFKCRIINSNCLLSIGLACAGSLQSYKTEFWLTLKWMYHVFNCK